MMRDPPAWTVSHRRRDPRRLSTSHGKKGLNVYGRPRAGSRRKSRASAKSAQRKRQKKLPASEEKANMVNPGTDPTRRRAPRNPPPRKKKSKRKSSPAWPTAWRRNLTEN